MSKQYSVGDILHTDNGDKLLIVDNNSTHCPATYSLVSLITNKVVGFDDRLYEKDIEELLSHSNAKLINIE